MLDKVYEPELKLSL